MNTTRIPKNLPPFTPNSDAYDVSPAGTVLLTAKWAYPQQGQAPETLATQTKDMGMTLLVCPWPATG